MLKQVVVEPVRKLVGFFQTRTKLESLEAQIARVAQKLDGLSEQVRGTDERTCSLDGQMKYASEQMRDIYQQLRDISAQPVTGLDPMDRAAIFDNFYDLKLITDGRRIAPLPVRFTAEKQIAFDSPDHLEPYGTRNDNTRHPGFVRRAETILTEIRHLDIGCAGGGLVWDFSIAGHVSVGVEGSDYSQRLQRAEWRMLPDRLFTADITHPFQVSYATGERLLFNLITAWELFEHIPTPLVADAIRNILENASPDAILVCSIATYDDVNPVTGTNYHQTVRSKDWWLERFADQGLLPAPGLFAHEDFVRGNGHNPRSLGVDLTEHPQYGFHIVLRRQTV